MKVRVKKARSVLGGDEYVVRVGYKSYVRLPLRLRMRQERERFNRQVRCRFCLLHFRCRCRCRRCDCDLGLGKDYRPAAFKRRKEEKKEFFSDDAVVCPLGSVQQRNARQSMAGHLCTEYAKPLHRVQKEFCAIGGNAAAG